MGKKVKYLLILLGILIFQVRGNCQIVTRSQVVHVYDELARIIHGFLCFETIFLTPAATLQQKAAFFINLDSYQAHPHLFEMVEAVVWKILHTFGNMDVDLMIIMSNTIFFIILLFSIYGIGSIIYSYETGLLAAFVVSMFPLVFGLSRIAMLDFPLMCMVALAFFLLLKTNQFSSIGYSILFGLFAGLSVLTKEVAIIFLIVPWGYCFIQGYFKNRSRRVAFNLVLALLCFVVVSGVVYLRPDNFQAYGLYKEKMAIVHSRDILFYLRTLRYMTGPLGLMVSIPVLIFYFLKIKEKDWFVFLWFIGPIILMSFSPNKSPRFILPVAPALAIIIACEIMKINGPKFVKQICVCFFILFFLAQYGFYKMGYFADLNTYTTLSDYLEKGLLYVRQDRYLPSTLALIDVFKKEGASSELRKVIFLFNVGEVTGTFELKMAMAHLPYQSLCPLELDEVNVFQFPWKGRPEEILMGDYVVEKTGNIVRNLNPVIQNIEKGLNAGFVEYNKNFVKIAEIQVFDNSYINVYKKIK